MTQEELLQHIKQGDAIKPGEPMKHLTEVEAHALIRATVRETFLMLGVKVDDPIEVQKDFQHLRDWRCTTDSIKSKGVLAIVGLATSGLLAALWVGFKELVKN